MGENPFYHHHAGQQYQDFARPLFNHDVRSVNSNHIPHADTEEEEYTIKCICGFSDDDGHTTLCEQCNTWQHVACFYWPDLKVPEVHQCADCLPRPTHPDAAAARQRHKREAANNGSEERKARRGAPKNQRKSKPKDNIASTHSQTNGWAAQENRQDSAGADYTPPLKRSKTHHRHSHSTAEVHPDYHHHYQDHQDHAPVQSPFKHLMPDPHPQHIAPEFSRAYRDYENYQVAENKEHNGYSNIKVVSILSNWLMGPDNHSLRPFHESVIDFEPPVSKIVYPDANPSAGTFNSVRLVATNSIGEGGLVGQVIGEIGLREEYMANPDNQWDRLRHPDHFVFFHPQLDKIFIDCRDRGSLMRFARRGCDHNVKLETIVTGDRNLGNAHFYLTAIRDIQEDEEIVLGWKPLDSYLIECIKLINSKEDVGHDKLEYVAGWVNNLLTHFGGCACDGRAGAHCTMRRFANLPLQASYAFTKESSKSHTQRQRSQRSPSKVDPEVRTRVENEGLQTHGKLNGTRYPRGSTRSSRSVDSRDATPNSHSEPEARNGLDSEPSEREKKKIAQQMRILEKLEQDNSRVQAKKKRRSGSHPHTPTTPMPVSTRSCPIARAASLICDKTQDAPAREPARSPNASLPPTRVRSPNARPPAQGSSGDPPQGASNSAISTPIEDETGDSHQRPSRPSRAKPIYVDAAVQTVPVPTPEASPSTSAAQRKPFVSLSQRLLRRNHQRRLETGQHEHPESSPSKPAESGSLPPMESMGAEPYTLGSAEMSLSDSAASPSPEIMAGPSETFTAHLETVKSPTEIIAPAPHAAVPSKLQPQPSATEAVDNKETPPANAQDAAFDSDAEGEYEPEPARVSSDAAPPPSQDTTYTATTVRAQSGDRIGPSFTKMHVDLPPPTFGPSSSMSTMTGNYTMSPSSEIAQSPSSSGAAPFAAPVAPMSAPTTISSTSSLTRPSPLKKKMSLSEYTSRNKARTPGSERTHSQTFGIGHAEAREAVRRTSGQSIDSDAVHQSPRSSQAQRELPRQP